MEKRDYAIVAFSAFFYEVRVFLSRPRLCFLSFNTFYLPHLFHYCKNYRNRHKTSIFKHVFMQIKVHKNATYFATLPAYFGYVRIAVFLFFGRIFPGGLTKSLKR